MADRTKIEWAEATWNPVRGCSRVSEGCRNCYAETMAARFSNEGNWGEGLAHFVTRPDGTKEARWTGKVMAAPDDVLTQPLRWKKPRLIFVNSTSDLFHEDLPDEWIDKVFAIMALAPQHTFQVLTKRPERMRGYLTDTERRWRVAGACWDMVFDGYYNEKGLNRNPAWPVVEVADNDRDDDWSMARWPLPNVWLGVSVEDQATADDRIPILLDTPAAIRWLSAEPLLGPVDLTYLRHQDPPAHIPNAHTDALAGYGTNDGQRKLDWVVVGGESGKQARPMHPDWARSLRDQCAEVNVPYFFKQWGRHFPIGQVLPGHPFDRGWSSVLHKEIGHDRHRYPCALSSDRRRHNRRPRKLPFPNA